MHLERRGIVHCLHEVKTKALIRCAVTAKLICAFVFTYYAKSRFSHGAVHVELCTIHLADIQSNLITATILNVWTGRCGQTVQTKIKLLL